MDLWKNKVVTKFKLLLGSKKAAAAIAEETKSFDESKEEINKEFQHKKEELKPKVIEIYEASSTEIKTLIKEPKLSAIKKHSAKVQTFLDELVIIGFPGSKAASEATTKYGAGLVPGHVIFVFEKVSTFIVTEEKTREVEVEVEKPTSVETTDKEPPVPATTTTTTIAEVISKEIVVEKAVVVEPEKAIVVEATKDVPAKVEADKPAETPKTEAVKPVETPKVEAEKPVELPKAK